MTYTPLNSTDNGSVSRGKINTNFESVDTQLGTKLEFSGTAPAVGDMAVFDNVDGLGVKKKVFTASQTLESDSNGQPTSAAKGTGYNLNLGTTAGTVLEGSNDALYMKLAGSQTVTGVKDFTAAAPLVPTQSPGDNTTKAASTAFVTAGLATVPSLNTVVNSSILSTSYITDRLMPTVGPTADAISNGWSESNAKMTANQGGGGVLFFDTAASNDASITTLLPGKGSQEYFRFADIGANPITVKTRIKFGTSPGATEAMSWGFNALTELEDFTSDSSIRFCLADNTGDKLYAVTCDTTAPSTVTNVTGSLTLTDWLNLAMVITSTQVLFYAGNTNALTLVATHTTDLPTGTTQMNLGWGIVDNGSQPDMYISPIYISLPTT